MAYIGRDISNLSDRAVLDSITTSATATYNLLLNSVAFVPSSAESLTVSLNGIIQKPKGSYSVSGSTIVFDSALTSSDVIDFILAERAITLTTVGSGSVGTSQLVDGSVSNAKLENSSITLNGSAVSLGGSATIGGGKIGQVLSTHTNATSFSTTSATLVDITGMSVAITPSATSSKILIMASVTATSNQTTRGFIGLKRDSTAIANGSPASSQMSGVNTGHEQEGLNALFNYHISFLDSPSSVAEQTYKVTGCAEGGEAFFLNRSPGDSNSSTVSRGASSITVMEVLA